MLHYIVKKVFWSKQRKVGQLLWFMRGRLFFDSLYCSQLVQRYPVMVCCHLMVKQNTSIVYEDTT